MGFTLSCHYFESFSTFVNWVVDREISNVKSLHYLDDFLFIGRAGSDDCFSAISKCIHIADYLGIPLAHEKTVYPTELIEFLGITINSVSMEFYLPGEKIDRMRILILKLLSVKKTTLKELQSLLGMLVFTARVIPMGRVFTKRLYKATVGVKSPFCHIRINNQMREDLGIWLEFLENFNGHSVWQDDFISTKSLNLFTDSAGSVGYGAFFNGR